MERSILLGSMMLAMIAGLAACDRRGPDVPGRLVDLSHPFDAETVYWPTAQGFHLESVAAGLTPGGFYYSANRFRADEHGGTHLDAPIHFSIDGQRVDQIPLARLVGPGARIDVRQACARDRDYLVATADLERWEAAHGRLPEGAIVLLHTDFSRFWPERERYLGTAERGVAATKKLHFPGLDPDAARWLVAERDIGAIGLDTASIDHGPSTSFETHQVLAAAQVPALENLTGLEELPESGFLVVALPMNIRGGSGAPLRAIAIIR